MVTKVNGGSTAPFNTLAGTVRYYKVDLTTNTQSGATAETVDFTSVTLYNHRLDVELVIRGLAQFGTVVAVSAASASVLHVQMENAGVVSVYDNEAAKTGSGYAAVEDQIEAALEANLYCDAGTAVSHTRNVEVAITAGNNFVMAA